MELTYKAIRQPGIPPTAVISAPGLHVLVGMRREVAWIPGSGASFMPNLERGFTRLRLATPIATPLQSYNAAAPKGPAF